MWCGGGKRSEWKKSYLSVSERWWHSHGRDGTYSICTVTTAPSASKGCRHSPSS